MTINLTPAPALDTWTPGDLITADKMNANVRDAQKFLAYAPVTIVTRAAAQSIPLTTQTAVTFDTEVIDVDGMFNAPSPNLTIQRPGVYSIQFQADFAANATGIRSGQITLNGTMVASYGSQTSGSGDSLYNLTAIVACNTGDVIQGTIWQGSGGALNTGNAPYGAPRMTIRLLSVAAIDVATPTNTNPKAPAPTGSKTGSTNPTKHTATFKASWSRTYDGNNSTTWDDSKLCYQGGDNANTSRGNTKSLVGFNYNSIKSTLAGATNITATLTFKVYHTWYNAGSPIYIVMHNYTSKPGSYSTSHTPSAAGHTPQVAAGHTYTFKLGSNAIWGLQNGVYTGVGFGPAPSTSLSYYAQMYGATQSGAPYLTFTYYK